MRAEAYTTKIGERNKCSNSTICPTLASCGPKRLISDDQTPKEGSADLPFRAMIVDPICTGSEHRMHRRSNVTDNTKCTTKPTKERELFVEEY
jgi:hypothetical protein